MSWSQIHFSNALFSAQLLRILGHTSENGADLGECLTTAKRIKDGDVESWYKEWLATAQRVEALAENSKKRGHLESAREEFMRAGSYYRGAGIFLIGLVGDPRLNELFTQERRCFLESLVGVVDIEVIAIPFEKTTLQGYFLREGSEPRRTLIINGGYDSTAEECYLFSGRAALRRGFNCLLFDGPGQASALIQQGMHLRPDWEVVITSVVDYLLTRHDVDPSRIALLGVSLGGYLAPRAVSREHRISACVVDPGQFDLGAAARSRVPFLGDRKFSELNPVLRFLLDTILKRVAAHPTKGWSLRRGMHVHGVSTPPAYIDSMRDYTLQGLAENIKCPTLVCHAESDIISRQSKQLFDALICRKDYIVFTAQDGADEHCECGARSLFNARALDWLDDVFKETIKAT